MTKLNLVDQQPAAKFAKASDVSRDANSTRPDTDLIDPEQTEAAGAPSIVPQGQIKLFWIETNSEKKQDDDIGIKHVEGGIRIGQYHLALSASPVSKKYF